jgi:hypothetical protein
MAMKKLMIAAVVASALFGFTSAGQAAPGDRSKRFWDAQDRSHY